MADIQALLGQAELELRRIMLEMSKAEVTKEDPVVKSVKKLVGVVEILIKAIRQQ